MEENVVYMFIVMFGIAWLIGLILSINWLICFIHYKVTGKNDWRYKYFGTPSEKKMFYELNYVLAHLNDFEKVYDYRKQVYDFLDDLNISDENKVEISRFFKVQSYEIYMFDDYKIKILNDTEWFIIPPNSDLFLSNMDRDKYIVNLVEEKLKEYNIIK